VFSAAEVDRISRMLSMYEDETSHQLAVLTVRSLDGESLESFSLRVANAWGLGQKGVDNGILVTLAPRERVARIELGLGFGPFISDAKTKEILNQSMIPAFARVSLARVSKADLRVSWRRAAGSLSRRRRRQGAEATANPSLHRTRSSGLRPPPRAGEL
jgi:uncharacterized membrane protein YgcG